MAKVKLTFVVGCKVLELENIRTDAEKYGKEKFSDLHYREDISLENNDDSDSATTSDED